MQTSYSADTEHIDEPIEAAARERTTDTQTIRIRIQPSILRRGLGQHRMWAGVSWTVNCTSVAEAVELRLALKAFFEAMTRDGAAQVTADLAPRPVEE